MPASPTGRSKALLERDGWTVGVVETWNPHARIRQDLWGFADLIAMKPGEPLLLVQATSGSNVAARLAKIAGEPRAAVALACGFSIHVYGWRRPAGSRRWQARIIPINPETPS